MHHGLLVAGLIIAELRNLLQCLANPGNIAVSKDTEASSEKGLFSPVAFYILVVEKGNDGLGHRHTLCCLLVHIRSPIIPGAIHRVLKGRFLAICLKKPTRVNPSAFALDLFGFGVYTCPLGAAGAMSFHDPLEGTETRIHRGLQ